jgi:GNAT superfamily N-acetyltransferase
VSDTITTRAFEASDIDGVLDLLRASLGEPPLLRRTSDLFAWKHLDNPFGASVAILAEANDTIVGLRTFMRWDLVTPVGDTIRCVRAVDTATRPEYQRRGIFRRLTEEGLELAVAEGIDLVFNTPNAKSGAGYLTMGWREVGHIGAMVRPTTRFMTKTTTDETNEPSPLLEKPISTTELAVRDREPRGLRTPRSEHYLRWRFGTHPSARYFRVDAGESVAVVRPNVRNGKRELIIADVFGSHPGHAMRRAARASRSAYIATWFSSPSPERKAAIRSGLMPVPGMRPLTLMARPLRPLDVDVFDLSRWDLAVGDLELL